MTQYQLTKIEQSLARIERALLLMVRIEERLLRLENRERVECYPSTNSIEVSSIP